MNHHKALTRNKWEVNTRVINGMQISNYITITLKSHLYTLCRSALLKHKHIHTQTQSHTHTNTYAHTRTHTHTHAHTRAHTRTHAHTHTTLLQ